MSKRPVLESEIQRQILAEIGAEPGFLLLKNSVGVATHYNAEGGAWKVPYGLGVSSPDLVGILKARFRTNDVLGTPRTFGVWVCMEVKVPGEDATEEQSRLHHMWRGFGALVYVVHSAAEAIDALNDARGQL